MFVSHSSGGQGVFLATDGCPSLVKGHVAFEADQTPFGNYDAGLVKIGVSSPFHDILRIVEAVGPLEMSNKAIDEVMLTA